MSERGEQGGAGGEGEKRFESSWVVKSEDELNAIQNESLKRRVGRLHEAAKQEGILNKEQWRAEYASLMRAANEDKYPEDTETIDIFLANMNEGIQKLDEEDIGPENKGNKSQSGPVGPEGFPRLSDIDEYKLFQDQEEWQDQPFPQMDPRFAPGYFVKWFNQEQRELFNKRRELGTAAFHKRRVSPPTLADLSKAESEDLGGFTKAETAALFRLPGVKEAVKLYLDFWEGKQVLPGAGSGERIRTAKDTNQEMRYRNYIRNQITPQVAHYVYGKEVKEDKTIPPAKELVLLYAKDAEQIAFNLLFVGNTFESLDGRWEKGRRVQEMVSGNKFINLPIRNAMHPLDHLIGSLKKEESAVSVVGKFGEWAYRQTRLSLRGRDVSNGFGEVEIIPETKDNKDKFWTVDTLPGGDLKLFAAECYPTRLLGSIWEETTIKVKDEKGIDQEVPLIDFLRRGEDIPWEESSISDGFWGDYNSKLDKAGTVWDFLQGKTPIRWDDFENVTSWTRDVNNALSKFQKRNVPQIKRWILYASCEGGVNAAIREPKLVGKYLKLSILSALGPKGSNYLPWNQLLFPWDQRGKF